jgi:hypothetical protein
MSRRRTLGTKKKIALLVSAAAVAGGGAFVMASTSNAATPQTAAESTVCQGLATALGNNQRFIEGQRSAPDAQSAARIANREAVIAQIKVQQEASGCVVGESAQGSQAAAGQPSQAASASAPASTSPPAAQAPPAGNAASGQQVCNGSTVTLSASESSHRRTKTLVGTPACASDGVPVNAPLLALKLAHTGRLAMEKVKGSASPSEAEGAKA